MTISTGLSSTPQREPRFAEADLLSSRIFFALTVLFVFFIAVVSWVPPRHEWANWHFGFGHFMAVQSVQEVYSVHDLRDIATNVLLYIPLGVFLALTVTGRNFFYLAFLFLLGLGVTPLMETGQMYLGRYTDPVDIATNTTGYLIGFFLVMTAVRRFRFKPRALIGIYPEEGQRSQASALAAIHFFYLCIYVIVALLPFDITVSLTEIYAKLSAGFYGPPRIILDPVYHFRSLDQDAGKLMIEFLGLLPVGLLTAFRSGLRARLHWAPAVTACLTLTFFCETAQVFVRSRTSDIVLFPMAIAAGLMGWGIVKAWFYFQHIYEGSDQAASSSEKKQLMLVTIFSYLMLICLFSWAPFKFENDLRVIVYKLLNGFNWIPFRYHVSTRSLAGALDVIKDSGLFVPLGVLMAYVGNHHKNKKNGGARPQSSRVGMIFAGALAGFSLGIFIEITQLACEGRYADITDACLAALGAAVGAAVYQLFLKRREPPVSP